MLDIAIANNAIPHPTTGEIIRTGVNWSWSRFGTEKAAANFLKALPDNLPIYCYPLGNNGKKHGFIVSWRG